MGFNITCQIDGSPILIPLIIEIAMGGSDNDTSRMISIVLFVSRATTPLHSYFGSKLSLT